MKKTGIMVMILALLLANLALTTICRKTLCTGLAPYAMLVILLRFNKKRWLGCRKRVFVETASTLGGGVGVIASRK